MTLQRHNGAYHYRGVRIAIDKTKRPDQRGRYSVYGQPFAQLNQARTHIDSLKGEAQ